MGIKNRSVEPRVVLLQDGVVYDTLARSGGRSAFQDQLLAAIKRMSGGADDANA